MPTTETGAESCLTLFGRNLDFLPGFLAKHNEKTLAVICTPKFFSYRVYSIYIMYTCILYTDIEAEMKAVLYITANKKHCYWAHL